MKIEHTGNMNGCNNKSSIFVLFFTFRLNNKYYLCMYCEQEKINTFIPPTFVTRMILSVLCLRVLSSKHILYSINLFFRQRNVQQKKYFTELNRTNLYHRSGLFCSLNIACCWQCLIYKQIFNFKFGTITRTNCRWERSY